MSLSAVAVTNAKPREKAYKLSDDRGLFLLVTPKGQRYWRFKYRFEGKEKILAFGVYPDVSLADAREKRDAARKIVAAGEDPAATKKRIEAEKEARSRETFSIIADEWLERLEKEGRSASTLSKLRWLTDFARPALGHRPIAEITAPELLEVLRKVEARGRYETANRLRSTFGTIFRYAIATSRAQRDVAYDLRGALITPKVSHRSAITAPKEVGALLRAIEGHEGQPAVRHGLRLLPHVFVRPGELRLALARAVEGAAAYIQEWIDAARLSATVPVGQRYDWRVIKMLPGVIDVWVDRKTQEATVLANSREQAEMGLRYILRPAVGYLDVPPRAGGAFFKNEAQLLKTLRAMTGCEIEAPNKAFGATNIPWVVTGPDASHVQQCISYAAAYVPSVQGVVSTRGGNIAFLPDPPRPGA